MHETRLIQTLLHVREKRLCRVKAVRGEKKKKALNPRNEKEWEMVLNPNLGHFCADEEGAEQIGPTYGDADVPAEFQLRRDHHTGHPCRRHVENNAFRRC